MGLSVAGFFVLVIWLAGRGRTLTGSVSDADTGVPIAGAAVATANRRTLTDQAGRFALHIEGRLGVLTIVADGYESREVAWSRVPETGTLDVSLVAAPERVLRRWLNDWQRGNYGEMYECLALGSQAEISRREFIRRLGGLQLERARVGQVKLDQDQAQVVVRLELRSAGRTRSQTETFALVREGALQDPERPLQGPRGGEWRIGWVPQAPAEPAAQPPPPGAPAGAEP